MKGSPGAGVSWANTRPKDESRTTIAPPIAPPINRLLCRLVGSCPLPDVLWIGQASMVNMEVVLSVAAQEQHHNIAPSPLAVMNFVHRARAWVGLVHSVLLHQLQTARTPKGQGPDRCLKTRIHVDQINPRVLNKISAVKPAVMAEGEAHDGIASHQIDDARRLPSRKIDAVEDGGERGIVQGSRHPKQVAVTIERQVHEELRGSSRPDASKHAGVFIHPV